MRTDRQEAENLLRLAEDADGPAWALYMVTRAQVHATLTLADAIETLGRVATSEGEIRYLDRPE